MASRRALIRITLLLLWGGRLAGPAYGQAVVHVGANVNGSHTSHLVGDVQPQLGYQWGGTWLFEPATDVNRWIPYVRLGFLRRGYTQRIAADTYQVRFSGLSAGGGWFYRPHPFVAVGLGVDAGLLVRAKNLRLRDRRKAGVLSTYRPATLDARLTVVLNASERIQPYVSVLHALRAALDYPRVDPMGNFDGQLRDIWHRTLQVGVQVRLYK